MRRSLRTGLVVAAAALASLAGSASGGAAINGCGGQVYEQPFLPWLDPANYVLAPGGAFEDSVSGWTLSGGAKVVSGNERFYVGGMNDSSSLALPAGSSVMTAPVCVTLVHPDVRFVVRNGGSALSTLAVSVVFPTILGTATMPMGTVAAGSGWQPTLPIPIMLNSLALVSPDGTIPVSFKLTPLLSGGSWQVDDFYVDPYKSG